MHRAIALLLMLTPLTAVAQEVVDLLAPAGKWSANIDKGGSKLDSTPTPEAPVALRVTADGGEEDYPKVAVSFPEPQDWRRFMRMKTRLRVTCDDPSVKTKNVTFVYYDRNTLRDDLPDRPMTQQCVGHTVKVGQWVELRDWMLDIHRGAIAGLVLYMYEVPPAQPHSYTWEIAGLQLEGVGEQAAVLDTEVYDKDGLEGSAGAAVGSVATTDGLELVAGDAGGIAQVRLDGNTVGAGDRQISGLMVRDVAAGGPPVVVGGVRPSEQGLRQEGRLEALGLTVEADYRSKGDYLEIVGKVADVTGKDRAVTVYFAVPLSEGQWRWWDDVSRGRVQAEGEGELSYVEAGAEYGVNGMHSKYPLGAATLDGSAGLTLGVRMDEPVVHRIALNPPLRLLYIALDFGLVPEKTVEGRPLSEAPFRILLWRHDPAWGFRSALQRYYEFFPEFFEKRVQREGGWYVWGDMSTTEGAVEAGFGFHWGPVGPEAVKWDNANGPLALLYIESEFYQQTMGDYDRAPTMEEGLERARKLAGGDEEELAKFMKLGYSHYLPGGWEKAHSHRENCIVVNRAAAASATLDSEQRPHGMVGQMPWMSESKWGIIFPCNLDPDIPDGKGYFCRELYLESGLQEMQDAGARFDGIGLDSFGGFGQFSRANFRREHFQYVDTPLCFSAGPERLPVIPAFMSSLEWVKELAAEMHGRGLVLMANCSWNLTPAWLTFLSPYLDIYGAEAPRFVDPEFARAIAYHKPCTDLPYDPRPDWEVARNQLWGIFPGHGNKVEVMKQFAATFRELGAAGWEPITYARATSAGDVPVRVERYGSGAKVYLAIHNPEQAAAQVKVAVDAQALGLGAFTATRAPSGESVAVSDGALTLDLEPQGTVVVVLNKGG